MRFHWQGARFSPDSTQFSPREEHLGELKRQGQRDVEGILLNSCRALCFVDWMRSGPFLPIRPVTLSAAPGIPGLEDLLVILSVPGKDKNKTKTLQEQAECSHAHFSPYLIWDPASGPWVIHCFAAEGNRI